MYVLFFCFDFLFTNFSDSNSKDEKPEKSEKPDKSEKVEKTEKSEKSNVGVWHGRLRRVSIDSLDELEMPKADGTKKNSFSTKKDCFRHRIGCSAHNSLFFRPVHSTGHHVCLLGHSRASALPCRREESRQIRPPHLQVCCFPTQEYKDIEWYTFILFFI